MKIAFCFMSYGDIVHANIWRRFFQDASAEQFCTVLHTVNGITATMLPSCRIIPTQPTAWGAFSLVEVQQALFEEACKDPDVCKCVLLSGDALPLYTFPYLYKKLTADDKGYMYYNDKHDGTAFMPLIQRTAWPHPLRYSLTYQWCILTRRHVAALTAEFPMIRQVFGRSYIPDEHVYSMFFEGLNLLSTFHLQMSTLVLWQGRKACCSITHSQKPVTLHTIDFTAPFLQKLYESPCFFIRKICRTALIATSWTADRILMTPSPRALQRPCNSPVYATILKDYVQLCKIMDLKSNLNPQHSNRV